MAEPSLLPPNATPWESAQSNTDAARWPLPTHLIKDVWNPWTCPLDLLPYLAAGLGLEIWHDDWSESFKRQTVADIWSLKRNKTKLKGIKEYLALEDATLISARRPRDKFWWSGGQTAAQRAATMAAMPQIHIALTPPLVSAPFAKAFWSGRTLKQFWRSARAWMASDAAAQYAERATYVDNGTATPVFVTGISGPLSADMRVSLRAPASVKKLFWGVRRFWGDAVWQKSDAEFHVISLTPKHGAPLYAVPKGLVPVEVAPAITADVVPALPAQGFWGARAKSGFSWGTGRVWRASDANAHVYYKITLFDPSRLGPTRQPYSFWSWSHWGRPAYTAQLRVQIPLKRPFYQFGYGKPWGAGYTWGKSDSSPFWRALAAIRVSKAQRDLPISVDTKLYQLVSFTPGLLFGDSGFQKFGDYKRLLT